MSVSENIETGAGTVIIEGVAAIAAIGLIFWGANTYVKSITKKITGGDGIGIIPMLGIAGAGYTGLKLYQAFKPTLPAAGAAAETAGDTAAAAADSEATATLAADATAGSEAAGLSIGEEAALGLLAL